jgi:hypothetical protein
MRLRIAAKLVVRVSTVLTLSAGLVYASVSSERYEVLFGNHEGEQNVDDRPLSPRLAALRDRLKAGARDALDKFWKEISERGAPIVESIRGNEREMLVTVLWRATEETRNVFVFASATLIGRWCGCSTRTCGTKQFSFRTTRASPITWQRTFPIQRSGEASPVSLTLCGTTR